MRSVVTTLLELAGFVLIVVGVLMWLGPGVALVVLGIVLVLLGWLLRPVGAPPALVGDDGL